MKKIMFNDTFGLTAAVLNGSKTMTRRIIPLTDADRDYLDNAFDWDLRESVIIERYAQYEVGEIVAVAQKYLDLCNCDAFYEALSKADPSFPLECIEGEKGCRNKMFVKAEWMPNRIRFTGRKIERLRSISLEDCLKEGVKIDPITDLYYVPNLYTHHRTKYSKPTLFGHHGWAYYNLCKKLRIVLDDSANPWVIAYTFELVKGGNQ